LAVAHDAAGRGEEEEGLWFAIADWGAVWPVVLLSFSVFSFCFICFFSSVSRSLVFSSSVLRLFFFSLVLYF
jgi:hypothetical protein